MENHQRKKEDTEVDSAPPPHLHVHPYVHVCMYAHECICNSVPHSITGRRTSQTLIWSHSPQELMMLGKMQLRPYSIELQTVPKTINKTQFGLLRTLCHLGERMAVFTSVDKLAIPVNKECNNLSTQSHTASWFWRASPEAV